MNDQGASEFASSSGWPSSSAERAPGTTFRVALFGEIDLLRQAELQEIVDRYAASSMRDVTVDLTEVSFLDSSGLSFLVKLHRLSAARRGAVTVVAPQRAVGKVLDLVQFDRIMTIVGGGLAAEGPARP